VNDTLKQIALGLAGGLVPPVSNARRTAVSSVVIAALALTVYVALIGAFWFWLTPQLGPAGAWLTIAGLGALGALIAWGITAYLNARARARAEAERAAAMQALMVQTAGAALTTLPRLVRDHPFLMMLAAAGIAYAAMPPKSSDETPPPEDDAT